MPSSQIARPVRRGRPGFLPTAAPPKGQGHLDLHGQHGLGHEDLPSRPFDRQELRRQPDREVRRISFRPTRSSRSASRNSRSPAAASSSTPTRCHQEPAVLLSSRTAADPLLLPGPRPPGDHGIPRAHQDRGPETRGRTTTSSSPSGKARLSNIQYYAPDEFLENQHPGRNTGHPAAPRPARAALRPGPRDARGQGRSGQVLGGADRDHARGPGEIPLEAGSREPAWGRRRSAAAGRAGTGRSPDESSGQDQEPGGGGRSQFDRDRDPEARIAGSGQPGPCARGGVHRPDARGRLSREGPQYLRREPRHSH